MSSDERHPSSAPGGGDGRWQAEDGSLPAPCAVRGLIVLFDVLMAVTVLPAMLFLYVYTNGITPTDAGRPLAMRVERRFSHPWLHTFGAPSHFLALRSAPTATEEARIFEGWVPREFWEGTELGNPIELRVHRGRWGMAFGLSLEGTPPTTVGTATGQLFATEAFTTVHRWIMTDASLPTALPLPSRNTDPTAAPADATTPASPRNGGTASSMDGNLRDGFVGLVHGRIDARKVKGELFGDELRRIVRELGDEALPAMEAALKDRTAAAELAASLRRRILSAEKEVDGDGSKLQGLFCGILQEMQSPRSIDVLVQAAKSSGLSTERREEAILRLGKLKHRPALIVLGRLLTDSDPNIRKAAAIALGELPSPKTFGTLCRTALHDDSWAVRQACAESLGRCGNPRAEETLLRLVEDEKGGVRAAAAIGLGLLGARGSVSVLVGLLAKDDSYVVRREAAHALGLIGGSATVEPLKKALKDAKPEVVLAAAEALHRMGEERGLLALRYLAKKGRPESVRERAAAILEKK